MDILLALLGGVAGTVIVQGLLRSFRVYRDRVQSERWKAELYEELGGMLKRINAVQGVKEFEDQLMALESDVLKSRPQTLKELDDRGLSEWKAEFEGWMGESPDGKIARVST